MPDHVRLLAPCCAGCPTERTTGSWDLPDAVLAARPTALPASLRISFCSTALSDSHGLFRLTANLSNAQRLTSDNTLGPGDKSARQSGRSSWKVLTLRPQFGEAREAVFAAATAAATGERPGCRRRFQGVRSDKDKKSLQCRNSTHTDAPRPAAPGAGSRSRTRQHARRHRRCWLRCPCRRGAVALRAAVVS